MKYRKHVSKFKIYDFVSRSKPNILRFEISGKYHLISWVILSVLWYNALPIPGRKKNKNSREGGEVQNVDIVLENGGTFCFCDFFKRPPPFEQKVPFVLFDFRNFRGDHPKSCKKYHLNFWFSRFARHHHPQNMVLFAKNQKVLQSKLDILWSLGANESKMALYIDMYTVYWGSLIIQCMSGVYFEVHGI
jgi:hypothetical protein